MVNGKLPSLSDIIEKLELVLKGFLTREEVSDWAAAFILDDELKIYDQNLFNLLNLVFGMDLKDSPTEYLHTEIEIKKWIEKYNLIQ